MAANFLYRTILPTQLVCFSSLLLLLSRSADYDGDDDDDEDDDIDNEEDVLQHTPESPLWTKINYMPLFLSF